MLFLVVGGCEWTLPRTRALSGRNGALELGWRAAAAGTCLYRLQRRNLRVVHAPVTPVASSEAGRRWRYVASRRSAWHTRQRERDRGPPAATSSSPHAPPASPQYRANSSHRRAHPSHLARVLLIASPRRSATTSADRTNTPYSTPAQRTRRTPRGGASHEL